ncbi:rho GTPase-activating protein 12 isoform X2 [Puntigrus tetrazona]|uniref:rho GTPase-activating protein 12 isoform X2 n=1 Tax=Puntigrus tetrazona TaxID=1606681 RepID=UPI001C8AEEDB|nr:rho GTPase-activating protein 12 isoform X2 [Puntigrus tetrazona]
MSLSQQVLVNYEYKYTARDGREVSIKPNEHYILVAKTNETWWHVRRDESEKPFFIPATYVTELPPETNQTQLDPPKEFSESDYLKSTSETAPDSLPAIIEPAEVTLRIPASIKRDTEKDGHRISTYIIPKDLFEPKGLDPDPVQTEAEAGPVPEPQIYDTIKDNPASPTNGETPPSIILPPVTINATPLPKMEIKSTPNATERPRVDSQTLDQDIQMLNRAGWGDIWSAMNKEENVYESLDTTSEAESSKAGDNVTVKPVAPDKNMVEDDSALTAVYVNLPRVRRGTPDPSSTVTSPLQFPDLPDTLLLDSAGWEIHTDDQSGQDYYYHPSTGRSTWEYPLSFSMESSVGTEEARSPPSFPQSPVGSPLVPSPPRWSSEWEKVLDENTGRHYFFNPVSGQSSWDPPEDITSPGPFLEDCPPPLPEEDYPASPDLEEEASPLSMPSEYSLIHVKKVAIPKASLDHSVPPGWTLSIDHEGAWVFTSDYTQEQWIKSLDDRGRTYYYLRDGSKSQWNLPEYSGSPGQYGVRNGATVEQDTMGSKQTWRHSAGYHEDKSHSSYPQLTSDNDIYSCPEMPHNVSNLEKAGILNKTKVSENGKKIRKNWSNSWTVLHGGILTFHKDPKSPAGASGKTNQIVPEFTVDLKGATLNRANKDKSSKKNVLELKSRTGVEYLIQYDTESIITDWYKIITDTIRQLDLRQDPEAHHSEDEEEVADKSSSLDREDRPFDKRTMSNATRHPSSTSTSEADQKKVRTKLKKFLLKRPTLQSVKDKGYIRENVFGCHLHNLCSQERTRVPSFVEKCIRTVEKKRSRNRWALQS